MVQLSKKVEPISGICLINSVQIIALADTGSPITIINKKTFDRIKDSEHSIEGLRTDRNFTVRTADGNIVSVIGNINVRMELNNYWKSINILVIENLTEDCLIGLDVLDSFPETQTAIRNLRNALSYDKGTNKYRRRFERRRQIRLDAEREVNGWSINTTTINECDTSTIKLNSQNQIPELNVNKDNKSTKNTSFQSNKIKFKYHKNKLKNFRIKFKFKTKQRKFLQNQNKSKQRNNLKPKKGHPESKPKRFSSATEKEEYKSAIRSIIKKLQMDRKRKVSNADILRKIKNICDPKTSKSIKSLKQMNKKLVRKRQLMNREIRNLLINSKIDTSVINFMNVVINLANIHEFLPTVNDPDEQQIEARNTQLASIDEWLSENNTEKVADHYNNIGIVSKKEIDRATEYICTTFEDTFSTGMHCFRNHSLTNQIIELDTEKPF